jgi:hypothetical protein
LFLFPDVTSLFKLTIIESTSSQARPCSCRCLGPKYLHLAADGNWTHDLVLTKDALYQLSYSSTIKDLPETAQKHGWELKTVPTLSRRPQNHAVFAQQILR